jgi:hypothetical protein
VRPESILGIELWAACHWANGPFSSYSKVTNAVFSSVMYKLIGFYLEFICDFFVLFPPRTSTTKPSAQLVEEDQICLTILP